jgi:PEGA domain
MISCADHAGRMGLAVLVALALAAAPLQAAPMRERQPAVLLPLELDGELADSAREELAVAAHAGLRRTGIEVRDPISAAICGDAACVRAQAGGARAVVRVRVTAVDRNYRVVVELIDGASGEPTASSTASCELCGTAELATLLGDQLAALAPKLAPDQPPPPRLSASSDPLGARVRLDARELGHTPLELEIPAGRHELVFDKPGWRAVTRPIEAIAGVDENVHVVLPRARRPLRAAGGALLGGGALLLGGGAVALAIDGRPYRRQCSGDDIDFAGRCRFRHDTAALGIALTSVGGALLIAGIAMLTARARRR